MGVTAKLPQEFSLGMEQVAVACEEAVQMPAKKKQCVAFDLSQNNRKASQAQETHQTTLSNIEKMQRALEGMRKVAELEEQLLEKAEKVKDMEKRMKKEVHFSRKVA